MLRILFLSAKQSPPNTNTAIKASSSSSSFSQVGGKFSKKVSNSTIQKHNSTGPFAAASSSSSSSSSQRYSPYEKIMKKSKTKFQALDQVKLECFDTNNTAHCDDKSFVEVNDKKANFESIQTISSSSENDKSKLTNRLNAMLEPQGQKID